MDKVQLAVISLHSISSSSNVVWIHIFAYTFFLLKGRLQFSVSSQNLPLPLWHTHSGQGSFVYWQVSQVFSQSIHEKIDSLTKPNSFSDYKSSCSSLCSCQSFLKPVRWCWLFCVRLVIVFSLCRLRWFYSKKLNDNTSSSQATHERWNLLHHYYYYHLQLCRLLTTTTAK